MNQPSDVTRKLMPQNIEAEESLISAILLDNSVMDEILEILAEGDFYYKAHKKIYAAALALHAENEPIDLVTLADRMQQQGNLQSAGGASYLAAVLDRAPVAMNASRYARIISERAVLRRLIEKAGKTMQVCFAGASPVNEILDGVEQDFFDDLQNRRNVHCVKVETLLGECFDELDNRKRGALSGATTGFGRLDRLTAGLQPADLIILAARPSMGKTALALNIARNTAFEGGVPVLVFSFEMSKKQLVFRMISSEACVDAYRMRDGFMSKEDWVRISEAGCRLAEMPIFIDDDPRSNILDIRSKARRIKMKEGLGLVVVDYLQLIQPLKGKDRQGRPREQEISEISRALKGLAKELQVPVMALSQLNRMVEQRDDKRPKLSDLRESGAIEQDADLVMFIYRDNVYNEATSEMGATELIIAKHRNGRTGTVPLVFRRNFTRFENAAEWPEGA